MKYGNALWVQVGLNDGLPFGLDKEKHNFEDIMDLVMLSLTSKKLFEAT